MMDMPMPAPIRRSPSSSFILLDGLNELIEIYVHRSYQSMNVFHRGLPLAFFYQLNSTS